jgi:hypothetical protein
VNHRATTTNTTTLLPEPLAAQILLHDMNKLPPRCLLPAVDDKHGVSRFIRLDVRACGRHAHAFKVPVSPVPVNGVERSNSGSGVD